MGELSVFVLQLWSAGLPPSSPVLLPQGLVLLMRCIENKHAVDGSCVSVREYTKFELDGLDVLWEIVLDAHVDKVKGFYIS